MCSFGTSPPARGGRPSQTPLASASPTSDDLSLPEIIDLRRGVADPCEDFVIVRAELGGDADLRRGLREMPRRTVDLEPFAVIRIVDLGDIAVGQHVGI